MASPTGTMVPCSAASGSVVGLPSASSAQPSGIGSPLLPRRQDVAARHLRERQVDDERRPAGSGQAKAIGLVPNTARAPPQGAMAAGELAKSERHQPAPPPGARPDARPRRMMRSPDRRHRDALRPARAPAARRPRGRSPEGEAERRVDASTRAPAASSGRRRMAVDLAGLDLVRIGRQPREAVALQPVGLGRDQRPGDGGGVAGRGAGADEGVRARARRFVEASDRGIVTLPPRARATFVDGHARHAHVRFGRHAGDVRRQDQVRAARRSSAAAPAAAPARRRRAPRRRAGRSRSASASAASSTMPPRAALISDGVPASSRPMRRRVDQVARLPRSAARAGSPRRTWRAASSRSSGDPTPGCAQAGASAGTKGS